jgi:eukaryotic-like serine/threonine-protein kinase
VRLTPGARLGPYEVLSVLGTGGMAEVYKARDTRLGRDIALKVVNEALASSPDLVRRFEQEARLAGSLNHPNVVAVYDIGLHEGAPYFITELLQGESLRYRLSRGRIPLQTALDWTAQMAQGLAAAHAHGVIHRDVKPDNIFISSDGHVKLLDFGIAKLAEAARDKGPHGLMDVTVTPTGSGTKTGSVLGTPGYMSPEQVRGESLDARTDIFSLGAVVYEMLSGKRAFPGATVVESGYAILHDEPEPLPSEVPPVVAQLVLHCLEKEPARRFQSAQDLGFHLASLSAITGSGVPIAAHRRMASAVMPGRRVLFGLLLIAGLAIAGSVALLRRPRPGEPTSTIEQITFGLGAISGARFHPDGRVIFSASFEGHPSELFSRSPGGLESQPLGIRDARLLSISTNGELAVVLHPIVSALTGSGKNTLAIVSGGGATPRELAENIDEADWSSDGSLAVVRAIGRRQQLEYPVGTVVFATSDGIAWPRISPSGAEVAFVHGIEGQGTEVLVVDRKGRTRSIGGWESELSGIAWGPGGKTLLASTKSGEIWRASLGSERRRLHQGLGPIELADVSPRGTLLVSQQHRRQDVVIEERDRQVRLSQFQNATLRSISDDGQKVLFTVCPPEESVERPDRCVPYLQATDGSPPVKLGTGYGLTLAPDARWVVMLPQPGETSLRLLPTGPGETKGVPVVGLKVTRVRWPRQGEQLVLLGYAPGEQQESLHVLPFAGGRPRRISGPVRDRLFEVSPDGRLVVARDLEGTMRLFPVEGGPSTAIPGLDRDLGPVGWNDAGQLWFRGYRGVPTRLILRDLASGRTVEQRNIAPVDRTGVMNIERMWITPDGKKVAFDYLRRTDYLFLISGLLADPS